MKILMISSYLPYPLYSGGQVRLYNLIKELSGKHEITLICEKRVNQTQQDISEVEKICKKVITVDRRKQWSVGNILKSGTSARSFLLTGHTHAEMQKKIQEALEIHSFDLIHIETFYVMQNLPQTTIPVVLVEHNIEYKVYEKFLQRASRFVRPMLAIDVSKIRKEEEAFWKKADALVAVSSDDKHSMEKAGFKPSVVSNGVNTEQFGFKDVAKAVLEREKRILFIGDFKWMQNRDSVNFIIREIWPQIKRQNSGLDVKLWIVGRSIPESIRSLSNDPPIIFDEKSSAKPTVEIFQEASVLLAPIRVGGGTSYKILESMSCGTPVVTMKLSADALEAKDGEELLVGQSAEELAEKILNLLQNKETYERISKNGRKFVEENYTWKKVAKKLDEVYEMTIK
jgi:glycosyltransferase involved in cell wall biosynthesis